MIREARTLTRKEVIEAMEQESLRPDRSETVILACQVALRKMKPEHGGTYTQKSQPEGEDQ